ncbi:hypothetical protein YQE_03497, partial [Dendroctonus ponderosae]
MLLWTHLYAAQISGRYQLDASRGNLVPEQMYRGQSNRCLWYFGVPRWSSPIQSPIHPGGARHKARPSDAADYSRMGPGTAQTADFDPRRKSQLRVTAKAKKGAAQRASESCKVHWGLDFHRRNQHWCYETRRRRFIAGKISKNRQSQHPGNRSMGNCGKQPRSYWAQHRSALSFNLVA